MIDRWLITAMLVLAVHESPAAEPPRSLFLERVAPILQRRCLGCHNGDEHRGGLSLETAASLLQGGASGPAIVPSRPEESYLLDLITPENGRAAMPRDADPLRPEEIATIREWITTGANWPGGHRLEPARVTATDWWSLQPLVRPVVPARATDDWSRTPVDRFIREKLDQHRLISAPEADRRTLIRRVTYDLIGLPPSPNDIDAFVEDDDPSAYERLVDRLLASPQYGERAARLWLDVVHFGETHGYDKDQPRPNAWPYRDYVIRAFNEDRPYGRFVEEQLAGDALFPGTRDAVEALGFLSAGPWDLIGHAEVPESKTDGKIARHLDRDDMVANTLQTFCSLTVQCAQCHNHKFDPITQVDYYRLQAVFAAIDRAEKTYDIDPLVAARRRELSTERDLQVKLQQGVEDRIAARGGPPLAEANRKLIEAEKAAKSGTHTYPPEHGYHSQIASSPGTVKWAQLDLRQPTEMTRIVLRPCHDDFMNIGAGFGFPVRFRVEVSGDPTFAGPSATVGNFTQSDFPSPGLSAVTIPVEGIRPRYLRVTATQLVKRGPGDYIFALAEIEVHDRAGQNVARNCEVSALDSIEAAPRWRRSNLVDGLYPQSGGGDPSELDARRTERDALRAAATTEEDRAVLASTADQLRRVNQALEQLPAAWKCYIGKVHQGTGAFSGTGGKPRTIRVLKRGNITQPGDEVGPGAIAALSPLSGEFELPADHDESARRAALARWITDSRHPLTWRTIVNRVWQQHFGRGIVDTPNDFGRNGQLPTHPELLDWLAVEFRDGGQSLKHLHRLIVTSSVYRQSSQIDARDQRDVDPRLVDADNRWLWRMNRRKLDAEQLRDSVLLVSGALDPTLYGPSFRDFVIDKPQHSPHYEYDQHDPDDPRSHRRAIYRFLVRSQPQPFMTVLDCADPSMQVARRNESVSSLQALALLNNPFMVAMSERFAGRAEHSSNDPSEQAAVAWRAATGRRPTSDESTALTAFAREYGLPNLCRVLLNANEFVFID